MKKSRTQAITVLGIIFSIVLILVGTLMPIPSKKISLYSFWGEGYEEYVGGDAYNIQIEASLRGGQISGVTVAKTILISSGIIIIFLTVAFNSIIGAIKDGEEIEAVQTIDSSRKTEIKEKPNSVDNSVKLQTPQGKAQTALLNSQTSKKGQRTESTFANSTE